MTFAPITYGGVPAPIAYFLLFGATLIVGLFPALFAGFLSIVLRRFGTWGILSAPVLWTAIEFLRFWATGNNWNAIAYSQAFNGRIGFANVGGIYLLGFFLLFWNTYVFLVSVKFKWNDWNGNLKHKVWIVAVFIIYLLFLSFSPSPKPVESESAPKDMTRSVSVVAIQPNVPMSGLKYEDRMRLQDKHVELSETALQKINEQQTTNDERQTIIIFPESPMNFEFARDREFQEFLKQFTRRNNVSVLFNAAEPTNDGKGLYNSAVLVDERGVKIAQYDKIHLVPFGEYVPVPQPLANWIPTMVGNFEFGNSYDLIPFGDAQAGIMICYESHFPNLSRQFAANGADVLVELTNDGYLGETPVLRQHLANAVFRAVETNRPVLRVTNIGITAYIDENGKVYDETRPYTEDTRVWTIKKSDAPATFYVRYGDWFAWLCVAASLILLILSFRKREIAVANDNK